MSHVRASREKESVVKFSPLVQTKVELLICHLHGYGTIDLQREEWGAVRQFASFLSREVERGAGNRHPKVGRMNVRAMKPDSQRCSLTGMAGDKTTWCGRTPEGFE